MKTRRVVLVLALLGFAYGLATLGWTLHNGSALVFERWAHAALDARTLVFLAVLVYIVIQRVLNPNAQQADFEPQERGLNGMPLQGGMDAYGNFGKMQYFEPGPRE